MITAQYFTWFACLLLVVFPRVIQMSNTPQSQADIDATNGEDTNHNQSNLRASSQNSQSNRTAPIQISQSNLTASSQRSSYNYYIILACLILLWASALGWWLWCAYCLEFLGRSTLSLKSITYIMSSIRPCKCFPRISHSHPDPIATLIIPGQSVYFSLWIASELFFVANAVVIVSIIVVIRHSLSLYHNHKKKNQSNLHQHLD